MKRTILSVAYPLTEVGEDAVGGSEQILTLIDRALTLEGHKSIVIAAEGSKICGTLIPGPRPKGRLDDSVREWARAVHKKLIQDVLKRIPVDLIHMHSLDFHTYLPVTRTPLLATLHLPPDWYPKSIFQSRRQGFWMNCVSRSQHSACPRSAALLEPIPNGVDVSRLGGQSGKRNFVVSLGRICPEKGFHFALDAARRAGVDMLLAGEVFPYKFHLDYFRKHIKPRLDRRRRFLGPVGFARKRTLLSQARCLLIPSTVAETSSLVAMEALACGTPVIAFRAGALPEIVDHGRTGFIVSSTYEMSQAIKKIDTLNPAQCREAARKRFSAPVMTARYLQLYSQLIDRSDASHLAPSLTTKRSAGLLAHL